jgi:hypothetical protein
MRILSTLSFLVFLSLSLSSCSTLSSKFSTENVMKVHQGMGADEILQLFGEPKSIRSAVCGREPNQWICTTWEYGEFPHDRASFTFSGELGKYILNNFDVKRD